MKSAVQNRLALLVVLATLPLAALGQELVANDDEIEIPEGSIEATINVLENDVTGLPHIITRISPPEPGEYSANNLYDGFFDIAVDTNFDGQHQFVYELEEHTEIQSIQPTESAADDHFGSSLAFGADTLVVGDTKVDAAAYVFIKNQAGICGATD